MNTFQIEYKQKTVDKYLDRLQRIRDGTLTVQGLVDTLVEKRVFWLKEHLKNLLWKYRELSPEEQAFNIIFFDYMRINPADIKMTRLAPKKIKIKSYNACPYLEACLRLGLDTRTICKEIGEPSFQAMAELINPNLRFSRDYEHIRPHNGAYCEEFIELIL